MGPVEQSPSVAAAGVGLATTEAAKRVVARAEKEARANIAEDVDEVVVLIDRGVVQTEGERPTTCQLLY